jgi:hypothetical protein
MRFDVATLRRGHPGQNRFAGPCEAGMPSRSPHGRVHGDPANRVVGRVALTRARPLAPDAAHD